MINKFLIVIICLLSIVCFYMTYLWLDITITRNYELKSAETTELAFKLSTQLLEKEWQGVTKSQVIEKLQSTQGYKEVLIVDEVENGKGSLWLNSVRFKFDNSKLISIGEVN